MLVSVRVLQINQLCSSLYSDVAVVVLLVYYLIATPCDKLSEMGVDVWVATHEHYMHVEEYGLIV